MVFSSFFKKKIADNQNSVEQHPPTQTSSADESHAKLLSKSGLINNSSGGLPPLSLLDPPPDRADG